MDTTADAPDPAAPDRAGTGPAPALDHLARLPGAVDELLAEAADVDLGATVPACPGWDVAALLEHLGGTYRWAAAMLRSGHARHLRARDVVPVPGPDPRAWARTSADDLLDALGSTSPWTPVWTFGPEPVAAFWRRRMLHETVVHVADVALAAGRTPRLDDDVARDGVDEHLAVVPRNPGVARRAAAAPPEAPAVLAFAEEVPEAGAVPTWLRELLWQSDGRSALVAPGSAGGPHALVRGTPTQLLLALWRRTDDVRVDGDAELWRRWSSTHAL